MAKPESKKSKKEQQAYLENYTRLVQRLVKISNFNTQQFLGTRPEGDPRVEYLASMEAFKNLANAQIGSIMRVLSMMLSDKKAEFHKIMEEELSSMLSNMEEAVGITGWNDNGEPQFDLQKLKEKTGHWPP